MTPPNRYAVVGNPVEHSRSPWIHAQFAQQTGRALSYERVLAPLEGFATTIAHQRAEGLHGCNVTVPFKFDAYRLASGPGGSLSTRAALAQAVNTLRFESEADGTFRVFGDNTDGAGLVRDITVNLGVSLAGKRVLLLGAGGAAAGVLGPLMALRPSLIVLANRTVGRSQQLFERHRGMCARHGTRLEPVTLALTSLTPVVNDLGGFEAVVNATTSSLSGQELPLPPRTLRPGGLGLDMMYGSPARTFLDWVAASGGQPRDGMGMLVEQAAESFEIWHGVRPQTAPVLQALRSLMAAT